MSSQTHHTQSHFFNPIINIVKRFLTFLFTQLAQNSLINITFQSTTINHDTSTQNSQYADWMKQYYPKSNFQSYKEDKMQLPLTTTLDIYDGHSQLQVQDILTSDNQDKKQLRTNYEVLNQLCRKIRKKYGMEPAEKTIFLTAVNHQNERQSKLLDALQHQGILPDAVDYRWVFVDQLNENRSDGDRTVSSLAFDITYDLGLLAGRCEGLADSRQPQVLVVTGSFNIYRSLLDFVMKRNGKAVLAFFKTYLERRFSTYGLFDENCPVKFYDLNPHSEALLGCKLDTDIHDAKGSGPSGHNPL